MLPAATLARWADHPAQMVRELFQAEPDPAQEDALERFPREPRIALVSCTGSGKTTTLAWIGWNFILTRPHAAIGVTSISRDNLQANLWTELARWYARAPLLQAQFEQTKTRIVHRRFPETWKMEARSWSKDADKNQIGNALRGLHAAYVLWLLDETGDYPAGVLPVAEAIFSGEPEEAHIVQAGNPLNREGPLYHAHTHRGHWYVINITADPADPKRTPRVSIEHAQAQIDEWGRDNAFVLVNVFGQFPHTSMNALIGPDEVEAAMKRFYREYEIGGAPKILGVDVAQQGDDSSVVFKREGIQAYNLLKYRGLDSLQGASIVNREWEQWDADAAFIDASGGFGAGWIDQLRLLGRQPIGVQFGAQARQKGRYFNKRAEMYFEAVQWIKRGGALPQSRELLRALTETYFIPDKDALQIEPKIMVKEKLGFSPDEADAFVLTFAEPVSPRQANRYSMRGRARFAEMDYQPYREENA